jgi:hypothetical protein
MAEAGGPAGSAAAIGMGTGVGMLLPPLLRDAMQSAPPAVATTSSSGQQSVPGKSQPQLDFTALASSGDSIERVQQMLRGLAQQNAWSLSERGSEWSLVLAVGSLRKQEVHVSFGQLDEAGHRLVSLWSSCGSMRAENALSLLRFNSQLVHGAFAVQSMDGVDLLVLRANLLADTADGLEIMRTITAIAWQADRVEEQMVGGDSV